MIIKLQIISLRCQNGLKSFFLSGFLRLLLTCNSDWLICILADYTFSLVQECLPNLAKSNYLLHAADLKLKEPRVWA